MITYDVNLCIGMESQGKSVVVKCHDTGVNLRVHLFVCRRKTWRAVEEPYAIPDGATAILKVAKPDKTRAILDGEIVDGYILFKHRPEVFTAAGISTAEVSLYDIDGNRLTTASFEIDVPKECVCDCDKESEPYVDILSEQIRAAIEAEEAAGEHAKKAEAAAGRAEEALSKVPTIGKNGHWFVWDQELRAYVDSGVYSGGVAPYISEAGTWVVGDTDTGVRAVAQDGKDGFSPTFDVQYSKADGGSRVFVTDATGRQYFFVPDGKNANIYIAKVGRSSAAGIAKEVKEGNPVCAICPDGRTMWMQNATLRADGELKKAVFSDGCGLVEVTNGSWWSEDGIVIVPHTGTFSMESLGFDISSDYTFTMDFVLTGVSTDYNKGDGNGDPNRDEGIHIDPLFECKNPSFTISGGRVYHYHIRLSEQSGVQLVWTTNFYSDYGTVLAGYNPSTGKGDALPGSLDRDKPYTLKIEKAGRWLKIKVWEKSEDEPAEWQTEYENDNIANNGYSWKFRLGHQNKGNDSEGAVVSNMVFRRANGTTFWDGVSENEMRAREIFKVSGGSWGDSATEGFVLTDRATGKQYLLHVDNGKLSLEAK